MTAIVLGIASGSVALPFFKVIDIIASHLFWGPVSGDPVVSDNIIWLIRMPRVLVAFLVGAALAAAGCAMQGLLRNPLADPYTLGVSSGASVGAVFVIYTGWSLPMLGSLTLPVMSITAGLLTLFIVIGLARTVRKDLSNEVVILSGIIVSSFLGALISLMIALSGENMRAIVSWLLGSVAMKSWRHVQMTLPFFLLGWLLLAVRAKEINIFASGEQSAHHMGVNVERTKLWILIACSCLTGAAVSVSGTIGFVGLVIPHMIRMMAGPSQRHLLFLSIVNGGTFLVVTDWLARILLSPEELPLGVITALVGAPVFALILIQSRKHKG